MKTSFFDCYCCYMYFIDIVEVRLYIYVLKVCKTALNVKDFTTKYMYK